jgi:hypothetical protein
MTSSRLWAAFASNLTPSLQALEVTPPLLAKGHASWLVEFLLDVALRVPPPLSPPHPPPLSP